MSPSDGAPGGIVGLPLRNRRSPRFPNRPGNRKQLMASAEQFLQLLEAKDLVSAQVLQEARREIQRTSPPPDAVGLSLWLVQGQHITASQAERLLAAVMEQANEKSSISRWQKGEPRPTESLRTPIPPPPAPPKIAPHISGSASSAEHSEPRPSSSQRPAQSQLEDLELAPEPGSASSKKSSSTAAIPAATPTPGSKAAAWSAPASAGANLEPLDKTMQGPLDSLVDSVARQAHPFEDPMDGPSLKPASAKKFKLRHLLRKLFRRDKSRTVKVKAADPRQVKLVLFSWGVAVLVILAALTLFRFLSPPDTVETLGKAEAAVEHGEYAEAIKQYDVFLKSYSKTQEADEVRGLRALAELRQAVQQAASSGDWKAAFDVAQAQAQTLPKPATADLLQKVGVALAQIADGMARQTQAKPDVPAVNRLLAIRNTIDTVIPASVQPKEMLEGIDRITRQCRQKVEGRKEIDQAVDEIGNAVAAGDLARAYGAYRTLVQAYPDLADNPDLTAAMKQVSAAQQKAVVSADLSLSVSRAERPTELLAAMPLAVQPKPGELHSAIGKLRFVAERGTAYGLDAATGKVLWRRFVARDAIPPAGPLGAARAGAVSTLPLADAAGEDVVVCDPVRFELLRVHGHTGGLVWRLAVGQPIAAVPVRAGNSLLALTQDQRLLTIDAATGKAPRCLHLPQPVKLPPVFDAAHQLIYLVAEQSNIYVLSYDDHRGVTCRQVVHLGHEAGTISAPPAVAGDYLFVPVNDSPDEATVRVLSIAPAGKDGPLEPVQRIAVKGYVDCQPVALGTGAIVVTAQGGILALERNEPGDKPFRVAARVEPALDERAVHFAVADGQSFWITGPQLTRYAVQSADGQIVTLPTIDAGGDIAEPPVIEGGTMFIIARRPGLPGVIASAADPSKSEAVWQTWLAAPLAAAPTVGVISGKLTAVTASGGMFRLDPSQLRAAAKPADPVICVQSARLSKPLCSLLPLAEERYAISSGAETTSIAIYDPQEQDRQFRWLVTPRALTAAPASFAGGVLAPCVDGQVLLLDPLAREDMMAAPFAISLPGVTAWNWRSPQAVDGKLAVLCDGDHRVIAIRLVDGSPPELAEAKVAPLSKAALVSPIAVLGQSVFVVDADNNLLSFVLPALSPGNSLPLGGRCAWGPQAVGKLLLAATDKDRLVAVDARRQVIWRVDLKYGPLAGAPCSAGDDICLSSRSGVVWRIAAADGKELGKADAGCPLGTGPLLIGPRLIVGGHDGSLLEVKKP
jgi:hypothetical protein